MEIQGCQRIALSRSRTSLIILRGRCATPIPETLQLNPQCSRTACGAAAVKDRAKVLPPNVRERGRNIRHVCAITHAAVLRVSLWQCGSPQLADAVEKGLD